MRDKEYHMIPEEETQCVWMTAGLISYKLCTRELCCEECMFDQVMRNEAVGADQQDPHLQAAPPPQCTRPPLSVMGALFYHRYHCWARVETPDEVRIGIDGILAALVARIKAVVLPCAGEAVTQDLCCAHIVQQRHILPLISPLSGSVQSVNQRLKKNPELIISDPWEEGWLLSIKPANLEHDVRALLCGSTAIEWYHTTEQHILQVRQSVLTQPGPDLGPTLQDGGARVSRLADLLTCEQYHRILESLCRTENPA